MRVVYFFKKRMNFILLSACMMLLMAGCGEKEAEAVPSVVVEDISVDDPSYVAPEDLVVSTELNMSDGQGAGSVTGTALLMGEEEAAEYLAGLSPVQIDSLYVEVLGEKGLNTQVAEGNITTSGLEFYLPDGFFEDDTVPGLYHSKRYPIDASNIQYMVLDRDLGFPMLDQDSLTAMLDAMMTETFGTPVKASVTEYETFEMEGAPALRAKCEYEVEEQQISQLMIAIGADKTYFVFYTMTQDYDRSEIFEESASTITLKAGGKGGVPIPEEVEEEEETTDQKSDQSEAKKDSKKDSKKK